MKTIRLTFILALSLAIFSCEKKETKTEGADTSATQMSDTSKPSGEPSATGTTYTIDTTASIIKWTGKKVTGKHNGTIKIKSGTLNAENGVVTGGTIVIDMTSITNEDLKKKEDKEKLIGHLKSEDFFSIEKYPTGTFEITRLDGGKDEKEDILTGKLTLKGKSEEISIPAKIKVDESKIEATGKTTIDRTKWDVRYGSGKFFQGLGDKMIYDDIELEIDLKAKK